MLGTGEYTTGFTGEGASGSDKSTGVVALTMLDMKRRGRVGRIGMCGTNGKKMPAIRQHMQDVIGPDVYAGIDPSVIETWPEDGVVDREAYETAVATFSPGDVAIIFTPDDTHMTIARRCLEQGMHVMITKPPVKTLSDHLELIQLTTEKDRLCAIEVHKRFDPIYVDARDRIADLGPFSYFSGFAPGFSSVLAPATKPATPGESEDGPIGCDQNRGQPNRIEELLDLEERFICVGHCRQ